MAFPVGKRMRLCRHLARLSREQAAMNREMLSASLIDDYEHEVEYPYPEQLKELSEAYDVTVDFLVGLKDFTPHAGRVIRI